MGGQMREELLDVAVEEGVEEARQSPHPFDVGVGDLEEGAAPGEHLGRRDLLRGMRPRRPIARMVMPVFH